AYDFGSGIVAEGTGMLLQNRGAYFSLDEKHVNKLEARKRTMHTLIPAMAARDGRPWAAFGSMGADLQPQLQAQLLSFLADEGLDPAEATARPRMAILPDGVTLAMEADYPNAAQLSRSDRNVRLMPAQHPSFGHGHAIVIAGGPDRASHRKDPGAHRAPEDARQGPPLAPRPSSPGRQAKASAELPEGHRHRALSRARRQARHQEIVRPI